MLKKWKNWLIVGMVAFAIVFASIGDAFGRGGSRSSSRSSRSSSRSSRPSSRSSRSVSRSQKPRASKPKSVKRSSNKPKRSAAQQKSYEAAKKNGTSFKSKNAAVSGFKSNDKMKQQYTSKYTSRPSSRPSHIPSTYNRGGNTYNVNYNAGYGGYGYMHGGSWMAYDFMTMASVGMMSSAMHSHNYYHDTSPVVATRVRNGGSGMGMVVLAIFGIVALVVVIGVVVNKKTKSS